MPWLVVLPLGRGFVFGHLWVLGFNILCFPCVCCLAGFYFGALVFCDCLGTCICGLHIEFPFEEVMFTCLCVHAFLVACLR